MTTKGIRVKTPTNKKINIFYITCTNCGKQIDMGSKEELRGKGWNLDIKHYCSVKCYYHKEVYEGLMKGM